VISNLAGDAEPTANGTMLLTAEVAEPQAPPRRLALTATVRPWVLAPVAARPLARSVPAARSVVVVMVGSLSIAACHLVATSSPAMGASSGFSDLKNILK